MDATLKALLHPVRWRIIQHLAQSSHTPADLHAHMEDIPQATLYRQLQTLLDAQLVRVVNEEKVRGAVERTYGLAGILDGSGGSPGSLREQALLVLNLLQMDVLTHLEAMDDQPADRLSMTRSLLYATDEEVQKLREALTQALTPLLQPHAHASPLVLGLVMTPAEGR